MVLKSWQAKTLIIIFKHPKMNQPVHMAAVNYVLSPFEGNIDPGYPTGIKLYLQSTKDINKETDKINITVSNEKVIVDHFITLANKYGWGRLVFMVGTTTVSKKMFRVLEQIKIKHIEILYFWESKTLLNLLQSLYKYQLLPTYMMKLKIKQLKYKTSLTGCDHI